MRSERWADLNVRVVGGSDGQGGGSGPVVVLMHGFGAPGDDLVPLEAALGLPKQVRFVFPEAPLSPPDLQAFGGRAWWPIDLFALQKAAAEGGERDFNRAPEGMSSAHTQLVAMLDQLESKLGVTGEQIVLGGFSQGAMLACDVVLRTQRKFAGVILLSGTLLCPDEWQPLMAARKGLPVLQSHGTHDTVLPHARAEKLRDMLQGAGLDVSWLSFEGGHELPLPVLQAAEAFVSKLGI